MIRTPRRVVSANSFSDIAAILQSNFAKDLADIHEMQHGANLMIVILVGIFRRCC